MKLVNIDTNHEMILFERIGKRCHFAKEILTDDYIIYLRVDWGDIKNSDPVLDADIHRNISGKKGEQIPSTKRPWHHTEKIYDQDSNSTIYLFKFGNLQLRLMSEISVAIGVGLDVILAKENEKEA